MNPRQPPVKWQARFKSDDPWFDVADYATACMYWENGYDCRELVAQPFYVDETKPVECGNEKQDC